SPDVDNIEIPQRIGWKTVLRIIEFLHYNSKSKKTHISMKCNIGYKKCIQYLNWMEMMDLINNHVDRDGSHLIILSEKGMKLAQKFSKP
ncbi:MAG: winged helix-turn-helix domain-containing protein, partial [Nitrosotalea sp.]